MKRSLLDRWGVLRVDWSTSPMSRPMANRREYRALRDYLRRDHPDPRDAELVRMVLTGLREMRGAFSSDPPDAALAMQVQTIVDLCFSELAFRKASRENGQRGGSLHKPRDSRGKRDDRKHTLARMDKLTKQGFCRVAAILRIAGEDGVHSRSVKQRLLRLDRTFRDK
jgi:hypothetical protein